MEGDAPRRPPRRHDESPRGPPHQPQQQLYTLAESGEEEQEGRLRSLLLACLCIGASPVVAETSAAPAAREAASNAKKAAKKNAAVPTTRPDGQQQQGGVRCWGRCGVASCGHRALPGQESRTRTT